MTNIHFAAIEMNGRDQPVFVSADIENDPMVKFIGGRKNPSQLSKVIEFSLLHNLEPTLQRHSAVGVFLPELDQRFAGDDMHGLFYISN